jgi:hypothetical protein
MTGLRENGLTRKEQLFRTLGREASLAVISLASMELTPRVGPHLHSRKVTEHGG